eukprot:6193157-Pleurochrysis_carterae.AAC.2
MKKRAKILAGAETSIWKDPRSLSSPHINGHGVNSECFRMLWEMNNVIVLSVWLKENRNKGHTPRSTRCNWNFEKMWKASTR